MAMHVKKCFKTYNATQLKNPVSQYSGKAPILKTSDHYFFQLHKCQDKIKAWLDTNPVSKEVRNKLNEWLESDLKDWDISRDAPYFGFKIPGTDDKYFYVWLDAPLDILRQLKNGVKNIIEILMSFGRIQMLKFIILLERIFYISTHFSGLQC